MLKIKELINQPEYAWINEYRDRLCFLTIAGSHGYGTNIEGSDVDIRGVMLPTIEELIGLKTFNQRIDESTDSCIYEFNQFIKLAANCNPNVIELLGCKQYLVFNDVGMQLIDNAKLFLSKRAAKTFGGYAIVQLRRLENALYEKVDEEKQLNYVVETIESAMEKQEEKNELYKDGHIKPSVINNELCFTLDIKDTPINKIKDALNSMMDIHSAYSKVNNRNNKKEYKALCKHIMHLVRLHYTCFDILENSEVKTYREKEHDLLMEIRSGKFLTQDMKVTDDFYPFLENLKNKLEELKTTTTLPEIPDLNELENLVIEVNKKVITDSIKIYEEPLEVELVY